MKDNSEIGRAVSFMKRTRLIMTPVGLKSVMSMSQTSETIARRFRALCKGEEPVLVKTYYINRMGKRIARYGYNHARQEGKEEQYG